VAVSENGNGNGRLTDKRKVFIEEYLQCWNGAEAARRAGYAYPRREAYRLLTNADIRQEVSNRLYLKAMSADEVLWRLAEIARGEWAQYVSDEGKVDFAEMKADGKLHLVKSIRDTAHGQSIEFCDMQGALVQIGKHHKLFVDRTELTGADGGAVALQYVGNVNPDDL